MPIYKATITHAVYIERDSITQAEAYFTHVDPTSIAHDCDFGEAISGTKIGEVIEVPRDKLKAELIAIGNDGEFFDAWQTEDAEEEAE